MKWRHEVTLTFFLSHSLFEQTVVDAFNHSRIFVVELGDESVGEFRVKHVPFNQFLQDLAQVRFDERLHICSLHLVLMLNNWVKSIVWCANEHLPQV